MYIHPGSIVFYLKKGKIVDNSEAADGTFHKQSLESSESFWVQFVKAEAHHAQLVSEQWKD